MATTGSTFTWSFPTAFEVWEFEGTPTDTDSSSGALQRERSLTSDSVDIDSSGGEVFSGTPLEGVSTDIDSSLGETQQYRELTTGPIETDNQFPWEFPTTFEDDLATEDIESSSGELDRLTELESVSTDIDTGSGELVRVTTPVAQASDPDSGVGELIVIAEPLFGESRADGEQTIIDVAQGTID